MLTQPVDIYKNVMYKKAFNIFLCSFKHEETAFPDGHIFMFFPYFIGTILSKICQKWGVEKKDIKRERPYNGRVLSIESIEVGRGFALHPIE